MNQLSSNCPSQRTNNKTITTNFLNNGVSKILGRFLIFLRLPPPHLNSFCYSLTTLLAQSASLFPTFRVLFCTLTTGKSCLFSKILRGPLRPLLSLFWFLHVTKRIIFCLASMPSWRVLILSIYLKLLSLTTILTMRRRNLSLRTRVRTFDSLNWKIL